MVTWNEYRQNGFMTEASRPFSEITATGVKPDSTAFAGFLPSVIGSADLMQGKEIHSCQVRHCATLFIYVLEECTYWHIF